MLPQCDLLSPAAIPISNLQPGCYEKYIAQHVDRCRLPEDTNKPHRPFPMKQRMGAKWQSEKREHTPQLVGKILFRIHPPPFSRVQKCAFSGDFFPNHFMLWFLSLQDLKAPTTPTKGSNLKRCAIHSTAAQGSTKELGQCEVSIQVFQFIACNDGMVDLLKKKHPQKMSMSP